MLKRYLLAVILFAAAAVPSFAAVNIAVVKSADIPAYNDALRGLRSVLGQKGFDIQESDYILGESAASIISDIRSKKPALIITVGSAATKAIAADINDIPVVFCMVLDPVQAGIVPSMESSGSNITGVAMSIPFNSRFAMLKKVFPDSKTIGVLYDPSQTGHRINEAKAEAERLGFILVAKKVSSANDVPKAIDQIMEQVDILWSVADSTVFSSQSTQYILLSSLRNKIPFVGFSANYLKAGAVMAYTLDYRAMGSQAGDVSATVLSGVAPSQIPVADPRGAGYSLNLISARTIGTTFSRDALRGASEVINE